MEIRKIIRSAKTGSGEKGGLPWAQYVFSAQFPGFAGHFPGQPVLPGVCMLQAVAATLEDGHGRGIRVEEVRKARFTSPIRPDQPLDVRCTRQDKNAEVFTAHATLRGSRDRETSACIVKYRLREGTDA